MNALKSITATALVLAVLALTGWGLVEGVGFLQGVLAPIDPATMSLVVAGWIGLGGAAVILAIALRTARAGADRTQRREQAAEAYAYLLDTWANADLLGASGDGLSADAAELHANVHAALRQAERRLALHGRPSVIDAYTAARNAGTPFSDAADAVVRQMRRDLGHTTFGADTTALLGAGAQATRPANGTAPRQPASS